MYWLYDIRSQMVIALLAAIALMLITGDPSEARHKAH